MSDPTQATPDMRRILQGEQEQVRRDPPPQIEVAAKIVRAGGAGMALLKINERYLLVQSSTRFSVNVGGTPMVYEVRDISIRGVELQSVADKVLQMLP